MNLEISKYNTKQLIFGTIFALDNRIQYAGDRFYQEITTKQLFMILVLQLFGDYAPTLKELSDVAGSSYQNIKQIILKLEKNHLVEMTRDVHDKRKIRVRLSEHCKEIQKQYDEKAQQFLEVLFGGIEEKELEGTLAVLQKMEQNLQALHDKGEKSNE